MNRIINKIPTVIEFWPYALKRNGLWESMLKNIENFDLDSIKYDCLTWTIELLLDAERSDLQSQIDAKIIIK